MLRLKKNQILSENQNKSGIYMWKNIINQKKYIGSAMNLKIRFREYFNVNYLFKNKCMAICCALLKHDYLNFSLSILEYCEPDKLLIREKYYIDLGAEYNIIKNPTLPPMSGRKHSDDTKKKISDTMTGKTLSNETKTKISDTMTGKNHTKETKKKISDAMTGENNPMHGKPRPSGAGKPSQQIEVTDIKNNTTTSYNSIHEAARALNIHQTVIVKYFARNQQKPYKGLYTFKKL